MDKTRLQTEGAFVCQVTQVVRDLQSILRIEGCEVFRASVDRPNLSYVLRPKPAAAAEAAEDICEWIRTHYPNGESGIVYCLTRWVETHRGDFSLESQGQGACEEEVAVIGNVLKIWKGMVAPLSTLRFSHQEWHPHPSSA
jgi:hypothetical protein